MNLLHNIDIIQAFKTGLGPADIFQILQCALLAVHIIRPVSGLGQKAALVQHGGHIGVVGGAVLHHNVGCTLQRQRVHRDILRVKGDCLTQTGLKALDRVPRQTRNQVHIDVGMPGGAGGGKAVNDVLRRVAAADVLQHRVREGLRIDRNARSAVPL